MESRICQAGRGRTCRPAPEGDFGLTNEQATTGAITKALRSFLKKPGKDDVVLLYFACHGASDTDRPDLVYLLTHDTEPDDISGTALPMREINTCIEEYLDSNRVVILADTCHSGAIGGGGPRRRAVDGSDGAAVKSYLERVSKARPGTALLMSAGADEVARENAKWGGGHGVFTHFLLEGLRGAADRDKPDGVVTLGELFQYVRDQVEVETDNKQHPAIGTTAYDRHFPMAITSGVKAQLHYEVGRQLYELGRHLDEDRPFAAAAQHLGEAQRFFRNESNVERQTLAGYLRGLALIALGKDHEAADVLAEVIKVGGEAVPPDTAFYHGIAKARLARADPGFYRGMARYELAQGDHGDFSSAIADLSGFLIRHPDHVMVPTAKQFMERLKATPAARCKRYALLIGVNRPADPVFKALGWPANSVFHLAKRLKITYGLSDSDITILLDNSATHQTIIREISRIHDKASPGDSILIYINGHAFNCPPNEFFFVPHDGRTANRSTLVDFRWLLGKLKNSVATVTILADTSICPLPEYGTVLSRCVSPPHSLFLPTDSSVINETMPVTGSGPSHAG